MSVTGEDIRRGLQELNVTGASAEVHSSLRSFGHVEGGVEAVVSALTSTLDTILVPTFNYDAQTAPPAWDRPARNGADYEEWLPKVNKNPKPFDPKTSPISREMGIISRTIAGLPGARRSPHPMNWTAYGPKAEDFVQGKTRYDPYLPLRRLMESGGYLIMLGVGLGVCTSLHLAEEMAGRKPFIRWAVGRDGQVYRCRAGGCSGGFPRLLPHLSDVVRESYIGPCKVLSAYLPTFLERAASIIRQTPEITMCPGKCMRCVDACAGGPLE